MTTDPAKTPKRRPVGRRPGANMTRHKVIDAARARFARDGYAATTIRKVAADAGVDASLVMQFFGSKNELFAAVMSVPPAVLQRIDAAFKGPDDTVGERVTRAFLISWLGLPQDSEPLLAMLRGAISQEAAATQLRDFIQSRLSLEADNYQDHAGDASLRVGVAAAMLIGVVVGRQIVGVPMLRDADVEAVVALVAPAIQSLLSPPGASAATE